MPNDQRTLKRDVEATLIPQGQPFTLREGQNVQITHRLGGNFTVMTENGMFRITGANADALGEEVEDNASGENSAHEGPPDEEQIWEQLKSVYDPEIPVNIVDLGLVYSMHAEQRADGGYKVLVQMTLTAPGCGMGPAIADDARTRVESVPGVDEAEVDIVWDPPWNQEMISEEGKMILGLI